MASWRSCREDFGTSLKGRFALGVIGRKGSQTLFGLRGLALRPRPSPPKPCKPTTSREAACLAGWSGAAN